MIKNFDGNIFDSNANFIVNPVNCSGSMDSKLATKIKEYYPHVEREYLKYLRSFNKSSTSPLGTAQYIPVDIWALTMTDTIKNNDIIAYDTKYQYIVNVFCADMTDNGFKIDSNALRNALADVRDKAQNIGATVFIPRQIDNNVINKIFDDSGVDVSVW